ncbi:glycosyltransferase family 2 protein [Planctomycetota bacterium]
MKPEVSIVIVNFNTRRMLKNCLESIYKQTDRTSVEIIVVDNDSNDGSSQMVRDEFADVKLIANRTNAGFARANDQGFEISTAPYVLMLNSDTIVEDRAIEKTIAFADKHADAAAVGCKMLYGDRSFQNSCFRFPSPLGILLNCLYLSQTFKNNYILNWDRYGCRDWPTFRQVDCVMGSFILLRREALEQVGSLDTDYFVYGEETDLCYRLKKAGWKVLYYPDTHIIHFQGGSQKDSRDLSWSYAATRRANLLFLTKWRHPAVSYICNAMMAVFSLPRVLAWAFMDVIGKFKMTRKHHLRKAASIYFHFRALFRPTMLGQRWDKI